MKDKLKNKGFWISLVSAVLVFVQSVGVKVDVPAVNEIVSALLTVLVVLGIISNPASGSGYIDSGGQIAQGGQSESAPDVTENDVGEQELQAAQDGERQAADKKDRSAARGKNAQTALNGAENKTAQNAAAGGDHGESPKESPAACQRQTE